MRHRTSRTPPPTPPPIAAYTAAAESAIVSVRLLHNGISSVDICRA